ncbi:MAG: monooxygenase [Deltaproteobacteria bacterium]|nr:monooxygenase [Deltaproteobacteria bacterium]
MVSEKRDAAVLVVGAGPTGLLLAAELQRRGVRTLLIDAHDAPLDWDRATVVHPRSLEIFESLGFVEGFLSEGVKQRIARIRSAGSVIGEIDLSICGSRYGYNIGISEEVTERFLTDYLHRLGGEVGRSSKLVSLEDRGEAVVAGIERRFMREEVTVDWVVGCDGYHSATRGLRGIELVGHDAEEAWAVFDVTLTGWPEPYEGNFNYLDGSPVLITALPGRRWRVYVRPSRPSSEDGDLASDALAAMLPYHPGIGFDDVTEPVRFRCHTKVAERYRSGRVLLAGDAAHVCSPSQGHGMNCGLQDAFNLAWKLALVCAGRSEADLLDSFELERRPAAERIVASGEEVDHLQTMTDPEQRRARDATLRKVFGEATSRHHEAIAEAELDIDYASSPIVMGDVNPALQPGERIPDTIPIDRAGDRSFLHELAHRAGHTALVIGGPSARGEDLERIEREARAAADSSLIEATVALVARKREGWARLGPDGAGDLGVEGVTVLVVRPDGHVGLRADRDHAEQVAKYQSVLRAGRP